MLTKFDLAQLSLCLLRIWNRTRTIEDLGDLFQGVSSGLREEKIGHGEEDDKETADW